MKLNSKIVGHIPTRIVYVCAKTRAIKLEWDDLEATTEAGIAVTPVYVADADNASNLASARKWAQEFYHLGGAADIERANGPFEVRVIGLEKRDRGGRAYKVVDDDNNYFDLREDVLLDAIQLCGIQAGGRINARFFWARVGSEMKLVRVDSELHSALKATTKVHAAKKLGKLESGGLYSNKKGERFLFFGYVSTVEYEYHYANSGEYDREIGGRKPPTRASVSIELRKDQLLFWPLPRYIVDQGKEQEWFGQLFIGGEFHCRSPYGSDHAIGSELKVQSSLAVIEKIADITLPADWLGWAIVAATDYLEATLAKPGVPPSTQLYHGCPLSAVLNASLDIKKPAVQKAFQKYADLAAELSGSL